MSTVLDFVSDVFFFLCPYGNGHVRGHDSHWFGQSRSGDLSHKTAESQSHFLRISTVLKLLYCPQFWVMTLCFFTGGCQRSVVACCLHFQDKSSTVQMESGYVLFLLNLGGPFNVPYYTVSKKVKFETCNFSYWKSGNFYALYHRFRLAAGWTARGSNLGGAGL